MQKALACIGAGVCIGCIVIYPKPTLFIVIVLFVAAVLMVKETPDDPDTD